MKINRNYEIVLFDLDGTLTEPSEGINNSVAYALEKFGISVEDKTELNKFIGPPLLDSFEKFYGFSHDKAMLAIDYYREYFADRGIFENVVYDGIVEMLIKLENDGYRLAVATSKPEAFAKRILDKFELSQYFEFIGGSNMDSTRSKKVDVIAHTLQNCKITDLSKAIMVGDKEHDIIGAKAVGIDSIGVLYGYGTIKELKVAKANYIAKAPSDVYKTIKSINDK